MSLFEFGEYWDTATFVFYMILGAVISALSYKGARYNWQKRTECRIKNKFEYSNGKIRMRRIRIDNKSSNNIYYITAYFLLVIVYTLKDISVGADSVIYCAYFEQATSFEFHFGLTWEPLFVLLTYLVRQLSDSYTVYFFFVALIIAYGYMKFIRVFWKSDSDFLFLILFVISFSYDFNILRSALGVSFLLQSLCALEEKNIKKAIMLSIIATLFQYTLIVNMGFIVFYFLLAKRETFSPTKVWEIGIMVAVLAFIASKCLRSYFASSQYYLYVTESSPTLLGNWAILLSGFLGIYVLSVCVKENSRTDVAILSCIYSIALLMPYMILGAYRITGYYLMPRLLLWGIASKSVFSNNSYSVSVKKVLIFYAVLFYALFTLSRRSSDPGFSYVLVKISEVLN